MENNNNVVVEETNQEKLYYPAEETSDDLDGKKLVKKAIVAAFAGATIMAGITFITKKIKDKRLAKQVRKESEEVDEDYVEVETDEDSGKTEK